MLKVGYCMVCGVESPCFCLCEKHRTKENAEKCNIPIKGLWGWYTPFLSDVECPVCGEIMEESMGLPGPQCPSCGYCEAE